MQISLLKIQEVIFKRKHYGALELWRKLSKQDKAKPQAILQFASIQAFIAEER